jgi:hypothetical protein
MDSSIGSTVVSVDTLRDAVKYGPRFGVSPRTISELGKALDYHARTGFSPVLINKAYFGPDNLPYKFLKETVRHERIHALHLKTPNHPFIKNAIAESPSIYDSVFRGQVRMGEWAMHSSKGPKGLNAESVRLMAREDAGKVAGIYEELYAGDKKLLESERLAFANQDSKTFFRAAESAGLKLPQKAGVIPPVSKALTAAAHEPVIEALHHGGWAQKIRKLLTSFGSGWQGLDITRTLRLLDTSHTANALTSLSKSIHTRAGARAMSKAL